MNNTPLEARIDRTKEKTGRLRTKMAAYASSVLIGLSSLTGCGHTIHYQDPSSKFWYDCQIDENYPSGHPCEKPVSEYLASQTSWSSGGGSVGSGDSKEPRYHEPREREAREPAAREKTYKVCFPK